MLCRRLFFTCVRLGVVAGVLWSLAGVACGQAVLVEAESFADPGGWKVDTQFIEIMGSPYLLAHGLGRPVDNATTRVRLPRPGTYRVMVRTKDWVARWNAPGTPGRFQLLVDGRPLAETFGTQGTDWSWQDGGTLEFKSAEFDLALHDLTGFEGRCDAIALLPADAPDPPNDGKALAAWRKQVRGLPEQPEEIGPFDLVVVGGGYAGVCSAVSAGRMGCRVALVQNRPVLGGNGSSEIRVWAQGKTRRGRFPRLGEIVEEFGDHATASPGVYDEFGDARKEKFVRAEGNVTLLLNHHATHVKTDGPRITAVTAVNTRSGKEVQLSGKLFADCTGHGSIGFLAGADFDMLEKGHMGMSNMWRWNDADREQPFPETPWALELKMGEFPYPSGGEARWFWEGGFNRHPIDDLEYIRDWNFRAAYGAFATMKREAAAKHAKSRIEWMAYIGGNRESRRLLGDVVLSEDDVVGRRQFPDGCVASTWSIDLHVPLEKYAARYPEDPFISRAIFGRGVDPNFGYPVPYRCFYSRNVENLFMAGRCISVTHEALGTVRVMRTCGMMGEVVGKAASICVAENCTPRDVYATHLGELKRLMQQPGRARRATVTGPIEVAGPEPPRIYQGIAPASFAGRVIDDTQAQFTGSWTAGTGVKGFVGDSYYYSSGTKARARFEFDVPKSGRYELRASYTPHENRSAAATLDIYTPAGKQSVVVDQQKPPTHEKVFVPLGVFTFDAKTPAAVVISVSGTRGHVVVDAIQILPVGE